MRNFLLLLLSFVLLASSCRKTTNEPEQNPGVYYFRANIGGQDVNLSATLTSTDFVAASTTMTHAQWGPIPEVDFYCGSQVSRFNGTNQVPPMGSVYIMKRFNDDPTPAEERAMFRTGDFPYGRSVIPGTSINGAVIQYVPNGFNMWTTEKGSQAGSTFTITRIYANPTGVSEKIMEGTFSCKLYSEFDSSLPPLQVTGGTFKGLLF